MYRIFLVLKSYSKNLISLYIRMAYTLHKKG